MKKWISYFVFFVFIHPAMSQVLLYSSRNDFPIAGKLAATPVLVDPEDYKVVLKAAELFQQDLYDVSGKKPTLLFNWTEATSDVIIIGSVERSIYIRQLVENKKLDISLIRNKWEAYQVCMVKNPIKGISKALVIAGSDRRGTAFGTMELSKLIGVSPWTWWADVPAQRSQYISFSNKEVLVDSPRVRYRGIFINDEVPALSGWAKEKFGGFNSRFYTRVFELMLRLKSNYLWPAMWGSAFYDDDSLNRQTADDYAIVIGTSHHEPMMRAHDEWRRYGKGKWNYDSNELRLKNFWKEGIKRTGNTEKVITLGMRGDGDEPMTQGTAISLLERIVADQRAIISDVFRKPLNETPQLWALYKEVQDYYDKGMRVPDDVTLLLCDDNWGNIRRLPKQSDAPRSGGYGIYYHFDYVGGPRNYKWINTNSIPRIWEQMHLAWEYDASRIWIVNVGDIKPMELPISFFLDYAWNPESIQAGDLQKYSEHWSALQFGKKHAKEIADILSAYTKFNSRRKPELLSATTYSLTSYNEWERVVRDYNGLLYHSERIYSKIPTGRKDAFFQLVLHPVKASANLHQLYFSVARNHFLADRLDPLANEMADEVKRLYYQDSLLKIQYHQIASGKWNHMMDQTHIGYSYWQQPTVNRMPEIKYVPADVSKKITGTSPVPPLKLVRHKEHQEVNGYVSIEASHFSRSISAGEIEWKVIPGIGRTGDGVTIFPVNAVRMNFSKANPSLEYDIHTISKDSVMIQAFFSPTLDYHQGDGLKYAIAIDDEEPFVVPVNASPSIREWEQWVSDNIIIKTSSHHIKNPGKHVVRIWMIDSGLVLQKLVVDTGGLQRSYLGPSDTFLKK